MQFFRKKIYVCRWFFLLTHIMLAPLIFKALYIWCIIISSLLNYFYTLKYNYQFSLINCIRLYYWNTYPHKLKHATYCNLFTQHFSKTTFSQKKKIKNQLIIILFCCIFKKDVVVMLPHQEAVKLSPYHFSIQVYTSNGDAKL